MRQLIVLSGLLVIGSLVSARVSVQFCRSSDLQPLTTNEIMTGKQCSILVSSDANDLWSGSLFIPWQSSDKGVLSARDKDPNSRDWPGSHLESAGINAFVIEWKDSRFKGFDLYVDDYYQFRHPGDWFVIDYQALAGGSCPIEFYDHYYSWTQADPNITLVMENIPTRDFNNDDIVDLRDFMLFSSAWMTSVPIDPNDRDVRDINGDGMIDVIDLTLFGEYWLWGSPGWKPADPSQIPPQPPVLTDADVIYKICDPNGLQEITLEVQQSIRLYLVKQTFNKDVFILHNEIQISDSNLGSIDNTEYEPDSISATAQILAVPRYIFFDYYGPGNYQHEGLRVFAANIFNPMLDGDMASFKYTAKQPGDVVLTIRDYNALPATTESILIHQVQPAAAAPSLNMAEMVEFLETIWQTDTQIRETLNPQEWKAFIDDVKKPVQTEAEMTTTN